MIVEYIPDYSSLRLPSIYEVVKHAYVHLEHRHPIHHDWFEYISNVYGVDRCEAEFACISLIEDGILPDSTAGWGFVYVLGSLELGYFKIGKANNLDKRVKQLVIQIPFAVSIVREVYVAEPLETEKFFHDLFADMRMNGEWFSLTEDQLMLVDRRSIPKELADGEDW